MSKIIVPNKQKLGEAEDIPLPTVKCSFCGNQTTTGMHQVRLKILKKAVIEKSPSGKTRFIPAVAKQIHYYMCPHCIAKGTKWPGQRP